MSWVNICGAAPGAAVWNAGQSLITQGAATGNSAESFLGSILVNGFDGNASAVWGAMGALGGMTLNLPQTLVGALGLAVSFITGALSAANDPKQGGACPNSASYNGAITSPGQLTELINQAFYQCTGMSPSEWASSNGAETSSGGITASSVVVTGGIPLPNHV